MAEANDEELKNYLERKLYDDNGLRNRRDVVAFLELLALKRLPEDERKFIELHYFKGFGINELSTIFNVPIRALYKKRDKILCKLNEYLSE
jgi:DNA-directed RNA polymerase specialized sigma24 family protein